MPWISNVSKKFIGWIIAIGAFLAGILAVLFGRSNVSGNGSAIKQAESGLADGQVGIGKVKDGIASDEKRLDNAIGAIDNGSNAIADSRSVLEEIRKSNPGK